MPDVVFRFRVEPEPRMEYISLATTWLLGYEPSEFYAQPELALSVAHPDDRDRLLAMLRSGDKTPATIRYLRKDGAVVWAEVKLNPFYAGKGEHDLLGVDGVVREVPSPMRESQVTRAHGGLEIDLVDRRVVVEGQAVHLTPAEFKLLTLLMEQPGRVVTRAEMMQKLWRSAHTGDGHTCEAHISNLRKKIERDPRNPERIVTVRGGGYRFAKPS